jgi:hypothetical protein
MTLLKILTIDNVVRMRVTIENDHWDNPVLKFNVFYSTGQTNLRNLCSMEKREGEEYKLAELRDIRDISGTGPANNIERDTSLGQAQWIRLYSTII